MRWDAWSSCFLAVFIAILFTINAVAGGLPRITLQIADHVLSAEIAHTQRSRSRGLMFRESLAKNDGMLFVFPKSAYYGMWMKNTLIPLSVAFVDAKGIIINITDMQPDSTSAYFSADPAKYALEMNAGWFAHKKIDAGHQIIGLEYVPEAD